MATIVTAVPLEWILAVGAALFSIGLFGALSRRTMLGVLMGVELMLTAANINLVAFWRFHEPANTNGIIFALAVIATSVVQVAVALALIVDTTRSGQAIAVDAIQEQN